MAAIVRKFGGAAAEQTSTDQRHNGTKLSELQLA